MLARWQCQALELLEQSALFHNVCRPQYRMWRPRSVHGAVTAHTPILTENCCNHGALLSITWGACKRTQDAPVSRLYHTESFVTDLGGKDLCLGAPMCNLQLSKQKQLCLQSRQIVRLPLSNIILTPWDLNRLKKERRWWTLQEAHCPTLNCISHHCLYHLVFWRPRWWHELAINYPQTRP